MPTDTLPDWGELPAGGEMITDLSSKLAGDVTRLRRYTRDARPKTELS
jgi:hypothetical protein